MILPKIRDLMQRMVDGLKTTSGSIFDPKFLDSGLVVYRAEIAYRNFKRDKGLNDIYYQDFNLILDPNLQANAPEGAVVYNIPAYIKLGDFDGLGYVGSKDFRYKWIRIKNPMQLANINLLPGSALCNNPQYTYYMPNMHNKQIIVWNNPTNQEATAHAIWADPCDLSVIGQDYNKDVDNYPIDEGDVVEIIELLKQDLITGKAFEPNLKYNQPSSESQNILKSLHPQSNQQQQ